MLQAALCNPYIHEGLAFIVDTKYGFQFPVPAGWWVYAADKRPISESAHLLLSQQDVVVGNQSSVTVLVCPAGGRTCSPSNAIITTATRVASDLAGAPGTLLTQPDMDCYAKSPDASSGENHCGLEFHEIVTKGDHTYEVIGRPLVPGATPPSQFTQILDRWTWIK